MTISNIYIYTYWILYIYMLYIAILRVCIYIYIYYVQTHAPLSVKLRRWAPLMENQHGNEPLYTACPSNMTVEITMRKRHSIHA